MRIVNPNSLMLLRLAQADAYCMAGEFLRPSEERIRQELLAFRYFLPHPSGAIAPGHYTDDTQMSIAVAELLLDGTPSRIQYDPHLYAEYFLRAFKRDPRKGYSKKFQEILETVTSPAELLSSLSRDSTRNGAAMRAVPLGVLPTHGEVWAAAATNASVTHNSEQGRFSSQAVALLSWYALHTSTSFGDIADGLALEFHEFEDVFLTPWDGPVVQTARWDTAVTTVHAVVTLLKEERSLRGILERVIRWGGDTDTVAAIAVGIASARTIDLLPTFLLTDLEPSSEYGPTFLMQLGVKLMQKYGGGEG